jgi:hypothetical protein
MTKKNYTYLDYVISHRDSRGRIPKTSHFSEQFSPVFGIDDHHRVEHFTYHHGLPWSPDVFLMARYITDSPTDFELAAPPAISPEPDDVSQPG